MNTEIIRHILTLILLCFAQVLVLNRICLFDCATPLLYVYFIMLFRLDFPRWATLLWSFAAGLFVDVFSNTPGMGAASATLLGLVQPRLLEIYAPRDSAEDLRPSMRTLGTARYFYYTVTCVAIFCLTFFTIEAFSFFNLVQWAKNVGGSTLLTVMLILAIESVKKE